MLVDTTIWIDHLRRGDTTLAAMLEQAQVLLASVSTSGEQLMTRDKRLRTAAEELGLGR